jgi:hypothetical protein
MGCPMTRRICETWEPPRDVSGPPTQKGRRHSACGPMLLQNYQIRVTWPAIAIEFAL